MTCPTCQGPLVARQDDRVPGTVLRCRQCRKTSVEGSAAWADDGPGLLQTLKSLKAQVDEDAARHKLMMESPIEHPIWENHSI